MRCHNEVIAAAKAITKKRKEKIFTIKEVREYLHSKGTSYSNNSIRGSVVSRCCIDSPNHKYPYFKRVNKNYGVYKLV